MTITRYLMSTGLTFIVGAYFGIIIAKARQFRLDRAAETFRQSLRKSQYTGQKCVECESADCDIYPAICDTCGAFWKADMHLEGSPRSQSPPPPDDVRGVTMKGGGI